VLVGLVLPAEAEVEVAEEVGKKHWTFFEMFGLIWLQLLFLDFPKPIKMEIGYEWKC
jgi:hypothetical protein